MTKAIAIFLLLASGCTLTIKDETGRFHASVQRYRRACTETCPPGWRLTVETNPNCWCEEENR